MPIKNMVQISLTHTHTQEDQKKVADCQLKEKCGDMGDIPKIRLMPKKILKGHLNKVNSVHFAADSR